MNCSVMPTFLDCVPLYHDINCELKGSTVDEVYEKSPYVRLRTEKKAALEQFKVGILSEAHFW